MKKPTNPLSRDLRFGGYLALPVPRAFDNMSNVLRPGSLARRKGLAEPFESWAIYTLHAMGVLEPQIHQRELSHFFEIYKLPNKAHFVHRLNNERVVSLIERVLANASAANSDPESEFTFDMVGVFGSVLHGEDAPGDVDIVFIARFKDTGQIIPESSYYPFERDSPTMRAAIALRGRTRRTDLNCHDLREVRSIGADYKILWTRKEGRVSRIVAASKQPPDPSEAGEDGLLGTDAKCNAFPKACFRSSPLPEPIRPRIPAGTVPMTFAQWASTLLEERLVTLLAQEYCLPSGDVKDCAKKVVNDWRATDPDRIAEAECRLFPFLAASMEFGTWKWDFAAGLIEGRPYRQRDFYLAQIPTTLGGQSFG